MRQKRETSWFDKLTMRSRGRIPVIGPLPRLTKSTSDAFYADAAGTD